MIPKRRDPQTAFSLSDLGIIASSLGIIAPAVLGIIRKRLRMARTGAICIFA